MPDRPQPPTPGNAHKNFSDSPEQAAGWGYLILYLVAGIGLFIAASAAIALLIKAHSAFTLLLLTLSGGVFLGGTVAFLGVSSGRTSWKQIGLWPIKWRKQWIPLIIALVVLLIPARSAVAVFFQILLEGDFESMILRQDILIGADRFVWLDFALIFISVAFLAPFFEELYFRGLLHRWFRARWKKWPAILTSSTIFGLAHFDSAGVAVSSFILGLVIAYAYEKTGSLWISIAIHAFNNGLGITLAYLVAYLTITPL